MTISGLPVRGITQWSVDEDAVSYDLTNSDSGTPQITVSGVGEPTILLGKPMPITLTSDEFGITTGTVRSSTLGASGWQVTADSPLSYLNADGDLPYVHQQPLQTCLQAFFISAGLGNEILSKSLRLFVHAGLSSARASIPAVKKANLWQALKLWLAANSLDLAWIGNTVTVYPQREFITRVSDKVADWSIADQQVQPFEKAACYVYHRTHIPSPASVLPHKPPLLSCDKTVTETPVISVDAGQVQEVEITLNAELSTLYSPVHVREVPASPDISRYPTGCFAIVGKDNKPITPAQWEAEGGNLQVKIKDDNPSVVVVTVTGMNNERLAPFRVAESDGKTDHPALHLVGTGALLEYERIEVRSGIPSGSYNAAKPRMAGMTEEVVIDVPAIGTREQAYSAIAWKLNESHGDSLTLNWSGINPVTSTFREFSAGWAVTSPTLGEVDMVTGTPLPAKATAKWPSGTPFSKIESDLRDWKQWQQLQQGGAQMFGRLAGSMVFFKGWWWRVTNCSTSNGVVSFDAVRDMRLEHLNECYPQVKKMPANFGSGITLHELSRRTLHD